MSIDQRTRMMKDVRPLGVEEILDEVIPSRYWTDDSLQLALDIDHSGIDNLGIVNRR